MHANLIYVLNCSETMWWIDTNKALESLGSSDGASESVLKTREALKTLRRLGVLRVLMYQKAPDQKPRFPIMSLSIVDEDTKEVLTCGMIRGDPQWEVYETLARDLPPMDDELSAKLSGFKADTFKDK